MTEAAPPVPGPPGPVAAPLPTPGLAERLHGLPVAEHVAVLAAEHDRLQRQLATIDQL